MDVRIFGNNALQLFGAGDVVNYGGDGTAANAGQYDVNNNSRVTPYGTLAPEIKSFYDTALIRLAGPNLVHDQFGQKRPIPQGNGRTVEFRRFSKLPKALTPITEGVTPTGNKMRVTAINAALNQYGDYIEQTDLLNLIAIDPVKSEAATELADQAGATLDTVVREVLVGGTNVMYAPSVSGSTVTPVTSRSAITSACRLRMKDVFLAAAELAAVNAPKINGNYVAIIHPYIATDLMTEAGDAWIDVHKYKNPEAIYNGEIGTLAGVRFVLSTEAKVWGPDVIADGLSRLTVSDNASSAATTVYVTGELTAAASCSIPCYINGVANTITAITPGTGKTALTVTALSANVSAGATVCGQGGGTDGSAVFATMFLGANAYGSTSLEGGGLEYIAKQLGYGNDPLNQRSSQGWKATKGAVRLVEEYMIRYESGSEFSDHAESN